MRLRSLAAALALLLAARTGHAEDLASKLASYESELHALGANLPQPNQMSTSTGQRRLVDAQVAYATGDYDTASLALFDLSAKSTGPDKDIATYYLAESLFAKGDRGLARTYYQALVQTGPSSRYYQQALQRIVEIASAENDPTGAEDALRMLDGTPRSQYIRGKHAFSQGKYDDAIALFASVPKGSDNELQALYYTATAQVAKQDFVKATDTYADLTTRTPKTNTDRRVVELSQLALGRIYYERDQASKSIDSYLLIDRKSDLFPTALYEVSWVYVKNKQYDKALVALELLGKLDPQSTNTPTVKILEGNLRVRKAQMLRQAEIAGAASTADTSSSPAVEYGKAETIFRETHDLYNPSYVAVAKMVDGSLNPASFIDQIAERNTRVFQESTPIPEAAAQWLREQPEVHRVVSVETDLGQIESNLDESQAIIERLEEVLRTGDRLTLYPTLSSRRMRIAAIQHALIKMRNDMAEQQIRGGASGGQATEARRALAAQYQTLGDPEAAYADRTNVARGEFDKIESSTREVQSGIMSTQAIAVSLRKYAIDVDLPADQKANMQKELDDASREARAIEDELADVRRELVLGKDLAGVGDTDLLAARDLRARLRAAQDAEQRAFGNKAPALGERAMRIASGLDGLDQAIERLVGQGIDEIKNILTEERKNLEEYKGLLAEYETDARTVGSEILAASFKDVKARFEDVIVRSDVGLVDVSWSEKEDSDDDYKRLNLARSRDLKQLKDEFRFVLDESTPVPGPRTAPEPAASPEGTSPDKGASPDQRVKPAGDQQTGNAQPTVKPDANKQAPKGGSK
ncbi:MAG: tetratricopeptide repeat protein [Kofleriaceae bacterium]|nr:tetratricopeptide repeat protein [Kofleriaceae bacterium]